MQFNRFMRKGKISKARTNLNNEINSQQLQKCQSNKNNWIGCSQTMQAMELHMEYIPAQSLILSVPVCRPNSKMQAMES